MTGRLEKLFRAIGAAALLALLALVVIQVVMRYGFAYTPFFTEEMARYMLVWSVLAGTAVSILMDSHIRVTFFPDLLPGKQRWIWMRFLDLLTLALLILLTMASVRTVMFAGGMTSDGMQLPLQYPYFILPVAFAAGLLFLAVRLKRAWPERPWKNSG